MPLQSRISIDAIVSQHGDARGKTIAKLSAYSERARQVANTKDLLSLPSSIRPSPYLPPHAGSSLTESSNDNTTMKALTSNSPPWLRERYLLLDIWRDQTVAKTSNGEYVESFRAADPSFLIDDRESNPSLYSARCSLWEKLVSENATYEDCFASYVSFVKVAQQTQVGNEDVVVFPPIFLSGSNQEHGFHTRSTGSEDIYEKADN